MFKEDSGIVEMDAVIATIVVIVFITMVSMVTINIYTSLVSMQKAAVCTDYAVKIFESAELMSYTDERLADTNTNPNLENPYYFKDYYVQSEIMGIIVDTGYKVELSITDYNKIPGNEGKQDLIKILDLKIYYMENSLEKNIEIKTLKKNV